MLIGFYIFCVILTGIGLYGQLMSWAVDITKGVKTVWLRNTLIITILIIILAVLTAGIISYIIVIIACNSGGKKGKS